jgi:hypothetical protein
MIIDICLIITIFGGSLIWRYITRPRNVIFQGESFHIEYQDRKCEVIHFDGKGTYRKKGEVLVSESNFNLAEWTWANKGHKGWLQN